MDAVVTALAPGMVHFVAGELKGPFHFLIGHPPIAGVNVLVVAAVFEKHADRLGLVFADQRGIVVSAPQSDISPNGAEDPPKCVGAFPGGRESANCTTAGAPNRAVIGIFRKADG